MIVTLKLTTPASSATRTVTDQLYSVKNEWPATNAAGHLNVEMPSNGCHKRLSMLKVPRYDLATHSA